MSDWSAGPIAPAAVSSQNLPLAAPTSPLGKDERAVGKGRHVHTLFKPSKLRIEEVSARELSHR